MADSDDDFWTRVGSVNEDGIWLNTHIPLHWSNGPEAAVDDAKKKAAAYRIVGPQYLSIGVADIGRLPLQDKQKQYRGLAVYLSPDGRSSLVTTPLRTSTTAAE